MAIFSAIAGGLAGLSALGKVLDNKFIAYFVVLGFLVADAGGSLVDGWNGIIGQLITSVLQTASHSDIVVQSWEVIIIIAFIPLIKIVIDKSGRK